MTAHRDDQDGQGMIVNPKPPETTKTTGTVTMPTVPIAFALKKNRR